MEAQVIEKTEEKDVLESLLKDSEDEKDYPEFDDLAN